MSTEPLPAPTRPTTCWTTARWTTAAALLLLLLGAGLATFSVVRYRWWIVAGYTLLTLLLAVALLVPRPGPARARDLRLTWAFGLLAAGIVTLNVAAYSYLHPEPRQWVRIGYAVTALAAGAVLLVPRRRAPDAALGLAVLGYLGCAVALIRLDPAPRIDVWIMLQQAADGLARGANMYSQQWTGSPGVQDAFTYLPWASVLTAPGRWLAGDVRWALVVITVLGAVALRLLPGRDAAAPARVAAAGAAALLLLLPGTSTQVEQAWTEPLLLTCLAGWALAMQRGRPWLAVLPLALGVASKQHLVVLLLLLACWPRFGLRRAVATGGLAGLLVLPWFLTAPADFLHDTVTLLIHFPPLRFADTLYIAAIQELGWTPPFWLTGALVLGTLGWACWVVRRHDPALAGVLRWSALTLLVANLVNKQAFYNQYWLVLALLLLAWAAELPRPAPDPAPEEGAVQREDFPATAAT